MERRYVEGGCEIRTAPSGKPVIAGYAAMFNRWSQDLGGFVEQIDPRAFDKTAKEADVRVLGNHDVNWLLGRTSSGSARISVDQSGLHYEADVNMSDPDGQRALAKVERGDWDGSSFGFRVINQSWNRDAEPRERTLLEVQLRDVGPATFPAYLDTPTLARNAVRTLAGELGVEVREIEQAFEAGGFAAVFTERGESEIVIPDLDALIDEVRAGKVLSAASVAAINAAIDQLQQLVDNAQSLSDVQAGEPDGDETTEPDETESASHDAEIEKSERLRSLMLRRNAA